LGEERRLAAREDPAMTRTNAATVLTVLVRAFALWTALASALGIAQWLATGSKAELGENWPWAAAIYAAVFLLAAALWLFADLLARAALAGPGQPVFESDLSAAHWEQLAFSAIGAWQAFAGLLECGSVGIRWFVLQRYSEQHAAAASDAGATIAGEGAMALLRLGAGIALVLGAGGIVRVVRRLRTAGSPPSAA
jgi:hypothetical protein